MNQEERDALIAILREFSSEIAASYPDSCAPWPAEKEIRELERLFQIRSEREEAEGSDV